MSKMTVLFIDDDDITEIIGRLDRSLKKNGITIVPSILQIGDQFKVPGGENNESHVLDFSKIKEELTSKYLNERYDLVACDFNFLDKGVNGFKLIKWLINVSRSEKKRIRNAKFVLYSSEKGKALEAAFSEDDMSDLVRLKLEDFIDRTKVSEDVANILFNSGKEINLTQKLIQEMDKHRQLKFRSTYPKFVDKTLSEIIHEIENETHHGVAFQHNLIELAVAHMIDLNK
jgi:hypothetical protein